MMIIQPKNFKCEDCGNDKFTLRDNIDGDIEITIYCDNKDCGAAYSFRPTMKYSSSCHPSKRCTCKMGLLSREDKYCSLCGKKNPNYGHYEEKNKKPKTKS